jgi:hypothetical protein
MQHRREGQCHGRWLHAGAAGAAQINLACSSKLQQDELAMYCSMVRQSNIQKA